MQEFVGRQEKREWTVTKEMLAVQMGSGMVPVLATPALIACMENACMRLVQPAFGEGITTVGTRVEVAHLAPTPEGARIQVTATLLATDGRRFTYRVEASDDWGPIGEGTHTRAIIANDRFLQKCNSKLTERK